jgi:hypothetical protein
MRELAVRRGEYRHNSYRTTKIYLTGKRYFGPLHSTSIHDITVSDIASRLNAKSRLRYGHCQQGTLGTVGPVQLGHP